MRYDRLIKYKILKEFLIEPFSQVIDDNVTDTVFPYNQNKRPNTVLVMDRFFKKSEPSKFFKYVKKRGPSPIYDFNPNITPLRV